MDSVEAGIVAFPFSAWGFSLTVEGCLVTSSEKQEPANDDFRFLCRADVYPELPIHSCLPALSLCPPEVEGEPRWGPGALQGDGHMEFHLILSESSQGR